MEQERKKDLAIGSVKIVYFLNDVDISYAIAYTVVDRAHHA